jgi:uncharacterized membrane protein
VNDRAYAPGSYVRGRDIEFDRAVSFNDAVYAIALTLLVVGIAVPKLTGDTDSARVLIDALNEKRSEFISFFVAFWIIGRYWLAHHDFVSLLRSLDRPLISLNIVYLAFVAFLPFPTGLIGQYVENPVSVVLFAGALALVSALEVVMFQYAWRHGHMRKQIPTDIALWGMAGASLPVAVLLVSMPIAFFVHPIAGLVSWLALYPLGALLNRLAPADTRTYFGD